MYLSVRIKAQKLPAAQILRSLSWSFHALSPPVSSSPTVPMILPKYTPLQETNKQANKQLI